MGRDMINKWVNIVLSCLIRNQHEETGFIIHAFDANQFNLNQ